MAMFSSAFSYSKIGNEDPEEMQHRLAQFLIYKTMQKADRMRRKPSWLRVKMFKVKIKIGKKLMKLRKGFSSAKAVFFRQFICVLKCCKSLVRGGKQGKILTTLPPDF